MSAIVSTGPMRVLLVEDSPADALLLRDSLAADPRARLQVVHTARLAEAFRRLEQEAFDVVLLDLSLPDADGLESLVRMHGRHPSVPIVVLTGLDDEATAVLAVRQGAQDYLVKGQGDSNLLVRSMRYAVERKRAEEELQHREEHFRSLIENALDIITVLDWQGIVCYASPSVDRVLGYRPAELAGRDLAGFLHPDDKSALRSILREGSAGAAVDRAIDFRFRHREGSWRLLEAMTRALGESRGGAGLIVNARDITSRKRAEEELRHANETLRAVIQTSPVAIYTMDPEGRVTSWNASAERVFGYSEQEVLGNLLPTVLAEDLEEWRAAFERVRNGEALRGLEARRARKDGVRIDVSIWITPLRDASGRISGVMAAVADTTERKRLEEQLRQSQKIEAIGRLAGGVAHDFNNLLTIITGYGDMLLHALDTGDPLRRHVEEITRASARAASLTSQLLAFSRRQVLQPRIVDLNEIVADMDKMLRRLIREDIELVVRLIPGLGCVRADPGQIEQVIVNLAVNAREAMAKGGRLVIETDNVEAGEIGPSRAIPLKPGRYVLLSVSDTGHGMDAETRSHIFEPFFTTKEKGKGTGLGLSTVYGIVKQSGGDIWVFSEPGLGSTFEIYFPRVEAPPTRKESSAEPAAAPRGSETILLVEDEEDVRSLLRDVLRKQGYNVIEAVNGAEALAAAGQLDGPISLLVTDVVMPQMSGHELASRLVESRPATRVLYISGYADEILGPRRGLSPDTRFIQKPFTADVLIRRVREILDR